MMAPEMRGRVFFQFPLRYAAGGTYPIEPLIAQPSSRPAAAGIVNHKRLAAMGGDPGLITEDLNLLYAMQQSFARGPYFDFFNQPEQLHPFAVVSPLGRLGC